MIRADPIERMLRRLLFRGAALYAAAAAADAFLTCRGLSGAIAGEGNPVLRRAMASLGVTPAIILNKTATGVLLFLIATYLGKAIHQNKPWIWKVPMSPWVRRWMQRGDRWWIALVPLYAMALAQAAAALFWIKLLAR